MANTPTTPASIASRLTDEEILKNASRVDELSFDVEIGSCGGFSCGDNPPDTEYTAAVLRDYVRMRKLANAVKANVQNCTVCRLRLECPAYGCASAMSRINNLLADAEKGEAK